MQSRVVGGPEMEWGKGWGPPPRQGMVQAWGGEETRRRGRGSVRTEQFGSRGQGCEWLRGRVVEPLCPGLGP